jgi:hypothetical protein
VIKTIGRVRIYLSQGNNGTLDLIALNSLYVAHPIVNEMFDSGTTRREATRKAIESEVGSVLRNPTFM